MAELSRTLGEIDTNVPLEDTLENLKVEEWDKAKVLEIFEELRFQRYIDRFGLRTAGIVEQTEKENVKIEVKDITEIPNLDGKLYYYLDLQDNSNEEDIIKKDIIGIAIYNEKNIYYMQKTQDFEEKLKKVFEDEKIEKYGYNLAQDYILLKQIGITMKNIVYDAKIAAYILDPTSKYEIDIIVREYLEMDNDELLEAQGIQESNKQTSLFENMSDENADNTSKIKAGIYAKEIFELSEVTINKLKEIDCLELFENIDMPTVEVLAEMQWNGMYLDIDELNKYGDQLKERLEILTKEIYELCGEEFNINSTKQLGEMLFEKLKLPVVKKTKSGYSTDVDVLEKLVEEHPVIEKILEYRQLMKLNSTYVEGIKPYINPKTKRIHSFFHQTITATGRISSTEPNLQNIPTRFELGKQLRKAFKPAENYIYIDADYSQIELRVLAHISNDENLIEAYKSAQDIHRITASKVFNTPLEEVTDTQRSNAKAVNFGIVYGISSFGLSQDLSISRKQAKEYIEQYFVTYPKIKECLDKTVADAKKNGYVTTLSGRRRPIPELKSSNFMQRSFGERIAMNSPIQGTAADIIKIAMINVDRELLDRKLKSRIVLQVHDELLVETYEDEIEEVKNILEDKMKNAMHLRVNMEIGLGIGKNWLEAH